MRTFTDIAGFIHGFHEGAAGHPEVVHPQGVIMFLGGLGRSLGQVLILTVTYLQKSLPDPFCWC